jgi:Mce-associated membrane protein
MLSVTTDKDTDIDPDPGDDPDAATTDTVEGADSEIVSDADDDQVTATDEDDDAAADADADKNVRPPRRVLPWLMAVLLIAAVAAAGFLGWKFWQQNQVARAGEAAQQAAVSYAQVLTSIDSNKVDENFAQVLDGATGEFKDMYSQSSMQLRQLLIDNKATAHGVVLESAVQSAAKNKAVVLLFVDQSVSNTNVPDPRLDRSRIKMTMELVDGRWRASKVELP